MKRLQRIRDWWMGDTEYRAHVERMVEAEETEWEDKIERLIRRSRDAGLDFNWSEPPQWTVNIALKILVALAEEDLDRREIRKILDERAECKHPSWKVYKDKRVCESCGLEGPGFDHPCCGPSPSAQSETE